MNMIEQLFSLKGKTVMVTGGARGIGREVANILAAVGANIIIIDLLKKEGSAAAAEIENEYGVKTSYYFCDVTNSKELDGLMEEAGREMGSLDILFNNAGICIHKSALIATDEDWLSVINVNLNAVFYMSRAFAKYLIANKKGGSIINTASMSGVIVNTPQEQASYNSSKAAVIHLTKSLAVEWAPYNIRVNCISPGYIETEMTRTVREDWQEYWKSLIPYKRMGKPFELAGAVVYLASNASSYTSGCNIIIDGCFTAV